MTASSSTTTNWTRDALDAIVDTRFRAFDEMTNSLSLTLVKLLVDETPIDDAPATMPALLLRGPVRLTWQQDSYTLCHRDLGISTVMLRPVGRDADGVYYEGSIAFDPVDAAPPQIDAGLGTL